MAIGGRVEFDPTIHDLQGIDRVTKRPVQIDIESLGLGGAVDDAAIVALGSRVAGVEGALGDRATTGAVASVAAAAAAALARGNHSGTQAQDTVEGLPEALADKASNGQIDAVNEAAATLGARVAEAEAKLAEPTPAGPQSVAEARAGAGGNKWLNGEVLAGVQAVYEHAAPISGSYVINGALGPHQLAVADGDLVIAGITGAVYRENTFRVIADGAVEVTFGPAVQVLVAIPQEDDDACVLADGQRLRIGMERFEYGGDTLIEAISLMVAGAATPVAPDIQSVTVTPSYSATVTTLTATYEAIGTPTPEATWQLWWNDILVDGATSNAFTPEAGEDGEYRFKLKLENPAGEDEKEAVANIGAPMPQIIGIGWLAGGSTAGTGNVPIHPDAVAGDTMWLIGVQQNSVTTGWATGFTAISGEIARIGAGTAENYRIGMAFRVLTADDISNGVIANQPVRSNSTVMGVVVRNLGSIDWVNTGFSRAGNAGAGVNEVALPAKTATGPGLAVALICHGYFQDENTMAAASHIFFQASPTPPLTADIPTTWVGRDVPDVATPGGAAAWGAAARVGARLHTKKVPTGIIPVTGLYGDVTGTARTMTATMAVLHGIAP